MDSPFQEVPGTHLLDRARDLHDSQSPAAVVPGGVQGRSHEPSQSISRFVRTPRNVVSPFVVPSGMSPMTPRHMVEGTPRSLLARSPNSQTPNGTPQWSAMNRMPRRRHTNVTSHQQLKGTPMRQINQPRSSLLHRSSGIATKLTEQVVPSTPKQQTDQVFSTPRSRSKPDSTKPTPPACTRKRNTPNMEINTENVILIDATGDHRVESNVEQTGKKRTTVARQRRTLIPRENSNNHISSDILDHIE